jgi:polyisoprenoid-binding protein YceI
LSKLAFILLFLAPASALALEVGATTAEVTFHISHPAKEYDGVLLPGGAAAVARFDPSALAATGCSVTIDVAKFNSDNVRRDSHMMESLEGLIFPTIEWSFGGLTGVEGPIRVGTFHARAAGPLSLHGVRLDLSVPVVITVAEDGTITVTSEFSVSLEEFGIERATLLFIAIADEIPISVKMVFPAGADVLYVEPPPTPNPEPETAPPEEPVKE